MKYDSKACWDIDLTIISDESELSSQQLIWCTRKLYAAMTANGNAAGVKPYIGSEFFHKIEFWGDTNCDLPTVFQLIAEMCRRGCFLETMGKTRVQTDALLNLGWELDLVGEYNSAKVVAV